jgi:flagellar M-ring protein FliF
VDKVLDFLKTYGPGRVLAAGMVLATVIAFFAVIGFRLSAPSMSLLYSDLAIEDSGEIVNRLESMGIAYEIKGNGSIIYVPDKDVLRLRMNMAEQGLPSGGSTGWELFDRSDSLGTTSFVQNINHLRALEGELARTIRTIEKVGAARVHLVLPRRELFSRESREPSASIVLKLKGGGSLEPSQVSAVQSLVAAAVPGLKSDNVSIVDDRGTLLSQRKSLDDPTGAATFTRTRSAYEAKIKSAVESLVEQSVGIGNVRAEVSADMNFDRVTTNAEIYDPDSQVARSTQSVEESNESSESSADQTVSVANNLPDAETATQNPNDQSVNRSGRTEETVNYEISKTIRTQVHESGTVKRISLAVLVDGIYDVDANGNREYKPRPEEDLKQLEALVKSSIGFDAERGDQVQVINMKFSRLEDDPDFAVDEGIPLTKNDYMRIGEVGGLVLIGLLIIFMVLRPLIARLISGEPVLPAATSLVEKSENDLPALTPPPSMADRVIQAIEAGEMTPDQAKQMITEGIEKGELTGFDAIDLAQIEGRVKASSTKKLVELVERHPEEAVTIMRSWMYQDA